MTAFITGIVIGLPFGWAFGYLKGFRYSKEVERILRGHR